MQKRSIAALTTLAASIAFVAPVRAHEGPQIPGPHAAQHAASMTDDLVRALNALETASPDQRAAAQQRLAQIVAQRRAVLLSLTESNPGLLVSKAIPAELRARMPAALQAGVEQEVDATGTVVARVADDLARGTARHEFLLEVPDVNGPRRFALNVADRQLTEARLHRMVGRNVKLRGVLIDSHIVVGDGSSVQVGALASKSGSTSSSTTTTTAALSTAIQGNQNTLVVMGNFTDAGISCTQSGLTATLFGPSGSVDSHYRESSRGAVTFSGEVIGPFNIPYSASGACDYTAWSQALDAAATAAGKNLGSYQRISYALPLNSSCGWVGLGYVGGATPTRSWVASCSAGVFIHEIGHNLSFNHASTPTAEYGDYSDPMGPARMVEFGGPNKAMAGWEPAGSVVNANGTGSYTLTSVSLTGSTSQQVLKVPKPDTGEFYYVALRTAQGSDVNLASTYMNLVSVHRTTGTLPAKTYLLANLGAGQTFTDSVNGITITPTTISGDGTTISLVTSTPACAGAAPTISMSPSSQSGGPGTTLKYGMTVTNKDGSTCSSSTFTLAQSLPAGFAGSFSPASVTLAPGASASVTWSVASPAGAANASYPIAAGTSSATGSASASGAYVVYSDTVKPTVSLLSPKNGSMLQRGNLSLTASASDNVGVKSVQFYVGSTLIGTDTSSPYSVTWNARKYSTGQVTITARAFDAAGNYSDATATVALR